MPVCQTDPGTGNDHPPAENATDPGPPSPSQASATLGATHPHAGQAPGADMISRASAAHHTTSARPRRRDPGRADTRPTRHRPRALPDVGESHRILRNCPPICPSEQRSPRFRVRNKPLTWSPLTESNRRPSPYHRSPVRPWSCRERPEQALHELSLAEPGLAWLSPAAFCPSG